MGQRLRCEDNKTLGQIGFRNKSQINVFDQINIIGA